MQDIVGKRRSRTICAFEDDFAVIWPALSSVICCSRAAGIKMSQSIPRNGSVADMFCAGITAHAAMGRDMLLERMQVEAGLVIDRAIDGLARPRCARPLR